MLLFERGAVATNTHIDYAPACVCGWRGLAHAATPDGYLACEGAGIAEHHINPDHYRNTG